MRKRKINWKNGIFFEAVFVSIFVAIALTVLFSSYYINRSICAERNAQSRRMEYSQLGESLADASDYLTEEVRYFAVTGDIQYLYHYWYEIYEKKQRDSAIEIFEKGNPPVEEQELLETAKKYSDLLVETETHSMKLVLLSLGQTQEDFRYDPGIYQYVSKVMEDELPPQYENMDAVQMRQEAIRILYDSHYDHCKKTIMTPIAQFQDLMNDRLDGEVNRKKEETRAAAAIQNASAVISIGAILFLMYLINLLYIRPQPKSIFLAQMSHELRTPLNAINGYTYLLEQTKLSTRQNKYVENIRNSSKGLLDLISQILDFSKIDSGHMTFEKVPFSIRKLSEEIRQILRQQAKEKGLYLHLHMDEKLPGSVVGDPLRLRQVLMNLIGNAVKFTNQGGIDVVIRPVKFLEGNRCLIRFEVIDTGIGVKEESIEKIFQPFTQSDASITRKYGGTGLGLPICSQIIAQSGDRTHRLRVVSEAGRGSTFYFELDYEIAREEDTRTQSSSKNPPDCSGKTILLVDDSEINIQVQSEILKLCHLNVLTAASGYAAIQRLKAQKGVDLILMDIRMPDMDGYETARQLRELEGYEAVPVLALTADATEEVAEKVKEAGMDGCILKPVYQEALFDTLRGYFGITQDIALSGEDTQEKESLKEDSGREILLFDEAKCLRHLSGNETSLLRIISTFLEWHGKDDLKILKAIKQNNVQEAEETLHLLKGVTGNLCCYPLSEACDSLRREIQKGTFGGEEQFQTIWNLTISEVEESYQQRIRKDTDQVGTSQDTAQRMTRGEQDAILERIRILCREYDTEGVVLLEKYKQQLEACLGKETMNFLVKCSLRYDFDQMAACLEEVQEKKED